MYAAFKDPMKAILPRTIIPKLVIVYFSGSTANNIVPCFN